MADQIGVQIVAADQQFIAATKATASAMAAVVSQEEKLSKAATAAGLDQKKFSTTFKALEKQRVAQEAKAAKDSDTARKNGIKDANKKKKADETKSKKDAAAKDKAAKLAKKTQKDELDAEKKAVGEALSMGAAVVAVGVAAAVAAVAIGDMALKALEAKNNAKGVLDVLTNGRGNKALELVDGLAEKLGMRFEDARASYVKFRQAGLDNKQSAQLLKLTADLNTVDHSGALAAEAIERVTAFKGRNGTAQTLALLAKQAHVAGDGTLAAAEAMTTLAGATNRLDNAKTKTLEQIGEKIKPSVDKAATAVANLVDEFLSSKRGQQAIQLVSDAISGLADLVTSTIPYFKEVGEAIDIALDNPNVTGALAGLRPLLDAVITGVKIAGAAVVGFGLVLGLAAIGLGAISNAIGDAVAAVPKFASGMYTAAGQLIDGLVNGIKDGAARVAKTVTDIASGIKDAFTFHMKINSPSKVFAGYGVNIGQGLDIGLNRSMPDGADMAQRMLPAPEAMGRAQGVFQMPTPIFGAPAAAQASGGSDAPQIVINLHGGATDGDAKRIRKEIDLWWMSKQQQQGNA